MIFTRKLRPGEHRRVNHPQVLPNCSQVGVRPPGSQYPECRQTPYRVGWIDIVWRCWEQLLDACMEMRPSDRRYLTI